MTSIIDPKIESLRGVGAETIEIINDGLIEHGEIIKAFINAGYPEKTARRLVRSGAAREILELRKKEIIGGELNEVRLLTEYRNIIERESETAAMEKIRLSALKDVSEITGLKKNEVYIVDELRGKSPEELIKIVRNIEDEIRNLTGEISDSQEGGTPSKDGGGVKVLLPLQRANNGENAAEGCAQFKSADGIS